jgi:hypothetical protein
MLGGFSRKPAGRPRGRSGRERTLKFELPPIESAADISAAMKGVAWALAGRAITPGEAGRIADVDTFLRAIETRDVERRLHQAEESLRRQASAQNQARRLPQLLGEILLQICCRHSKRKLPMPVLGVECRYADKETPVFWPSSL